MGNVLPVDKQALAMAERAVNRPVTKSERRKAIRFPVFVPIEVKWQERDGKSIKLTAQAKEVNALGGLLDIKTYPSVGSELELTNLLSGAALPARVVAVRRSGEGHVSGVAVELVTPNETFWGVNFQLRKTSTELLKIEEVIKSGGVDPAILVEFRDAVDYVRKTAWAVQEWQERQLQKHDPQTVLSLLTTERIRRGTQLNKAIAADLIAHRVARQTAGMDQLFGAVEKLYQQVVDLFRVS